MCNTQLHLTVLELSGRSVLVLPMHNRRRYAEMLGDLGERPIFFLDHSHDGLPRCHELGSKRAPNCLAIRIEIRHA